MVSVSVALEPAATRVGDTATLPASYRSPTGSSHLPLIAARTISAVADWMVTAFEVSLRALIVAWTS